MRLIRRMRPSWSPIAGIEWGRKWVRATLLTTHVSVHFINVVVNHAHVTSLYLTWESDTFRDGATPSINSTLYGSRRAFTVFSQRQFHGEQKARVLSLVGEQWRPVDGYSRVVQHPCRAWHHPSRLSRVATYGLPPAASSTATGRRLCSSTCDLYPCRR